MMITVIRVLHYGCHCLPWVSLDALDGMPTLFRASDWDGLRLHTVVTVSMQLNATANRNSTLDLCSII
jgi:hypothetical protein